MNFFDNDLGYNKDKGVPPRGPKPRGLPIPQHTSGSDTGVPSGSISRRRLDAHGQSQQVNLESASIGLGDFDVGTGVYPSRRGDKSNVEHNRAMSLKRETIKGGYAQEKELDRDKAHLNQRMIDLSNSILNRKVGEWKNQSKQYLRGPVPGDGANYIGGASAGRRAQNSSTGNEKYYTGGYIRMGSGAMLSSQL